MTHHTRYAKPEDVAEIVQLVNSAYRGESSRSGWTTEADLLTGVRVDADAILTILKDVNSVILLCTSDDALIGSVHLERDGDRAYLGMFVVKPTLQGSGIGKQLMQQAELTAQSLWGVKKMWMQVITARTELIAFYERRGYVRTGRTKPFSSEVDKAFHLVDDLQLEELEKNL